VSVVGCNTVDENINPTYGFHYVALEELEQKYPRETSLTYCEAKTKNFVHESHQDAVFNLAGISKQTHKKCREDFYGNVKCKSSTYLDIEDIKKSASKISNKAYESAMESCMVEVGYVKEMICLTNCMGEINIGKQDYDLLSDENKLRLEEAKTGNIQAKYNLGVSFVKGVGAPKDITRGINILKATAENNHFKSQYALGIIYEKEGSFKKAAHWYERAANLGHIESQFRFGWFYFKGEEIGISKDLTKAKRWLEKAAKSGHSLAQFFLGAINYKNGQSIEAYKWIYISEQNGLEEKFIKNSENLKNKLAQKLTESQIENSKRIALQCIESSYQTCS
jgi:TPR repeat protein